MDFSVLISIYRGESPAYFREALDSLFAQTLQPAEIVLVRDGPLTPELVGRLLLGKKKNL